MNRLDSVCTINYDSDSWRNADGHIYTKDKLQSKAQSYMLVKHSPLCSNCPNQNKCLNQIQIFGMTIYNDDIANLEESILFV